MFLENTSHRGRRQGWIEVICGSMFSGKTEELIRRMKRAEFAKMKVESGELEQNFEIHSEQGRCFTRLNELNNFCEECFT